jgi:Ala-tRNA(Pro) deacylase
MQSFPPYYPQNTLNLMDNLKISYQLYTHIPVFTVEEADKVSGDIAGAHIKNLFLRDKREQMFLVTLRSTTKLDLKKLSDLLGSGRFSFGSPERLWTYLGVKPGSVTPLAILNDTGKKVTLILEKGMMEEEIINIHPLDNGMTVGMHPKELMKILENKGISPQITDLNSAKPDEI